MRLMRRHLIAVLLLVATAPALANTWKCLSNREGTIRILSFEGGIDKGEFARFRSAFVACFPDNYSGQRTVDLNSGGGSVAEALQIARAIAGTGSGPRPVATQVSSGSVCISACTYLFISGRLRNVRTGGSFEPHGFSSYKGARIDEAIRRAQGTNGDIQWGNVDVQIPRLLAIAAWMPLLAAGDGRFNFAAQALSDIADSDRATKAALLTVLRRFASLPDPQRAFIQNIDAILASAVPELERVAALKGFERLLVSTGAAAPTLDERRYFNWVAREVELAANAYLRAINDSKPAKLGDDFLGAVLSMQRERVESVIKTVRSELGPYLESRADQIDIAGLVKLMFSVSILYTRPLTREELCDLNIVNRDCGN